MSNIIKIKAGSGVPTTSDIVDREMAFDRSGNKLYINDSGTIVNLSGAQGGGASDTTGAVTFTAQAGEALSKGDVVYISGLSGNTPIVSKADADDSNKMPAFGLAAETASLNNSVEVVTFGILENFDTSSFTQGTVVYVSTTAGALSSSAPTGESSLIQNIGYVVRSHASTGAVKIGGAGRTNATPNLNQDKIFLGNASNQAEATALSSIGLSSFNNDSGFTTNVGDITGVTAGSGLSGGGTSGSVTLSHADTSSQASVDNSGRTYIQDITLDTYGHVTAISSATETVTDTDTTYSASTGLSLSGTAFSINFKDEDDMLSNSALHAATQQSIKAYVDTKVAAVVDSAPAALDTLNELAAALGDDANFSTTTSTALGNRLRVDTAAQGLTGTQQANAITNLGITATKAELNYVDGVTSNIQTQLNGKLSTSGTAANSQLLDSLDSSQFLRSDTNDSMTGNLTVSGTVFASTLATDGGALNLSGGGWGMNFYIDTDANSSDIYSFNSDNSQIFTIDGSGNVVANGTVTASGGNSGNWNTAYGWGNHASAGYLTSSSGLNASNLTSGTVNTARLNIPSSGDWFSGGAAIVATDGVMEIGRYIDFHNTDTSTDDYHIRLDCESTSVLNVTGGTLEVGGSRVLTVADEGSGNGIDADTLDGNHASAFLTTSGTAANSTLLNNLGSGSFLRSDATDTASSKITFSSGLQDNATHIGTVGGHGLEGASLTAQNWADFPVGFRGMMRSGQGSTYGSPTTNYGYFLKFANRDSGGGWGGIWIDYNNTTNAYIGTTTVNTSYASWGKIWTDTNDGSGSGLDADLLDGVQGSSFLRSDADDTMNEALYMNASDSSEKLYFQWQGTTIGDIGAQDTTWLRINQSTAKNIYTPRYIRADGGFFVDGSTLGLTGTGKLVLPSNHDTDKITMFAGGNEKIGTEANTLLFTADNLKSKTVGGSTTFTLDSSGQARFIGATDIGLVVVSTDSGSGIAVKDSGTSGDYYNGMFCSGNELFLKANNTERLRVESGGNIKITNNLEFGSSNIWQLDQGSWTGGSANQANIMLSGAAGTFGIHSNTSTADLLVDGAIRSLSDVVAYYSDIRLKEKFEPITNAIEKVESLDTFTYESNELAKELGYNEDYDNLTGKRKVGVSAQQVQEILPEAVTLAPFDTRKNEDGTIESISGENYLTVKYEKLVPLLIQAIKEQQQQINELKEQLNG
jgi:hypothetical protein